MSLSNPLTVLFWLGIYGSILAKTVHTYDTSQLILYSVAIFTGIYPMGFFNGLTCQLISKVFNFSFSHLDIHYFRSFFDRIWSILWLRSRKDFVLLIFFTGHSPNQALLQYHDYEGGINDEFTSG